MPVNLDRISNGSVFMWIGAFAATEIIDG